MRRYIPHVLLLLSLAVPFFANADVCAVYSNTSGAGNEEWGDATGNYQKAAQEFTVSENCDVTTVQVYSQKVGSPADNPTFSLYTVVAGVPTVLLETGSTPTITSSYTWAASTFSGATELYTGVNYFLVLARSGTASNSNKWNDSVNNVSPPYVDTVSYNGTAWAAQSAGYEMNFEVDGSAAPTGPTYVMASSTQIVVDPDQDLFDAALLFLLSMVIMVWLMRAK